MCPAGFHFQISVPVAGTSDPHRGDLREKGLVLAHSWRVAGASWPQWPTAQEQKEGVLLLRELPSSHSPGSEPEEGARHSG